MTSFIEDKRDQALFNDVVFLIEASYAEMFSLWREFAAESDSRPRHIVNPVKWEQESLGKCPQIGALDHRQIVVSIVYAKLNGKRVMFYYGCSQLVDHKMIDEWLRFYTEKTVRWDNGSRWAQCNASNFHHCLDAIGWANK